MADIADNLASVRRRIAEASARANRNASEVTLVAVTKTVTPVEVRRLYDLGVRDFGENRVADGLGRKAALAAPDARWHMIGHLQRNKAAAAVEGGFLAVHSVESAGLLDVLDRECAKRGLRATILLEANLAGEESKYGVPPDALADLVEAAAGKENLCLAGLMTMAPLAGDPEASRPVFRELRRCRDSLAERFAIDLPHLSMGMTGDFEVAVEEGATMVRVGTALYA